MTYNCVSLGFSTKADRLIVCVRLLLSDSDGCVVCCRVAVVVLYSYKDDYYKILL